MYVYTELGCTYIYRARVYVYTELGCTYIQSLVYADVQSKGVHIYRARVYIIIYMYVNIYNIF